ncbi:MAG TPA: amidohydrolase family protein, partial [Pyrinomonadaceae bacterium]|nr:amidohydrolase family protein [Pyrinomonadaceae bacterium]
VMDLKGHYVIPGLIDSHYHLLLNRGEAEETARRRFALYGGITTVRDMAGDAIAIAEVARQASDPTTPSPRIYFAAVFAGPSWFKDERVGLMMHGRSPGQAPWALAVTPQTDIRKAVAEAKATGATGIKMYADLSAELAAEIAREARRQNLKVWSHVTLFPSKPGDVLATRPNVVSHAIDFVWEFMDKLPARSEDASYRNVDWANASVNAPSITNLLRRMSRQQTFLDATLLVTYSRVVQRQEALPEKERAIRNPQLMADFLFGVTRRAHLLGVPIVTGSDIQEAPRRQEMTNIHAEMELLVTRCGLTPLEAITAATRNGARVLGVERDYGTIEKGKVADLVVLSADPSLNIRNTTKIVYVIKGGHAHKREKVVMPS